MIQFDNATYVRFVSKAKDEGIKVRGNLRARRFVIESASGNGSYVVTVGGGAMPTSAQCTCPAGQHEKACKHAAAALAAVRKAQASNAARILNAAKHI